MDTGAPLPRMRTLRVADLYAGYEIANGHSWLRRGSEYASGQAAWVIRGLSFELPPDERLVILGESGSGKSTIFKALLGLGVHVRGKIFLDDVDLLAHPEALKAERGRGIGIAFQDAMASFSPLSPMRKQILDVARTHRTASLRQLNDEAHELMDALALPTRAWTAYPGELSGGMAARMGICCALLAHPDVLLLDEPTAGVDEASAQAILNLIQKCRQGLLIVTHDLDLAQTIGGTMIMLHEGKAVESGSTRSILANPREEYTQEFVQAYRAVHPSFAERSASPALREHLGGQQ